MNGELTRRDRSEGQDHDPTDGNSDLLLLSLPDLPPYPRAAPGGPPEPGNLGLTTEMAPSLYPVSGCSDAPEHPNRAISMNIC